jgi:hypothetical protein
MSFFEAGDAKRRRAEVRERIKRATSVNSDSAQTCESLSAAERSSDSPAPPAAEASLVRDQIAALVVAGGLDTTADAARCEAIATTLCTTLPCAVDPVGFVRENPSVVIAIYRRLLLE